MRIAFAVTAPQDRVLLDGALRHGHEVLARLSPDDDLIARVNELHPEVVLVSATPSALTAALMAHCDGRGVRLVAVVADNAQRRHARGLGLFESVAASASWEECESVLGGSAIRPAVPGRSGARGTVITVWGPAGSPGRTSIAIGVAAELARAGYSVAIGDVDTHSASVAPTLGMLDEAPGFAAACRLAGADGLTISELERIGQQYRSGGADFWVLTGIGQPSRWPELSAERVSRTIAECRKWVDFTVLDTGFSLENDEEISSDLFAPRRNAATVAAIRDADHVIAVGAADPVGLSRFLRAHGDLLETATTETVSVVMNKVRASAIGMNPAAQVNQTLARFGGITSPVLVPFDHQGMDAAILSGKTLAEVAPKSPARLAIRQFVESRLLPAGATVGKAGRRRTPEARSRFAPATG